jgi:nucleotide-binding universal stress UspA family protein
MHDDAILSSHDSPVTTAPVIVVGLDGSSTSWDAFSWAAGEATRSKGNLVAVYVTPAVEPVAVFGESLGYGPWAPISLWSAGPPRWSITSPDHLAGGLSPVTTRR